MEQARATTQDIRPLKIVIVNLMPTKIATETQLARVLANSPLQVEMTLVQMDSHESTHISQEHMDTFYKTLDEIKHEYFDGMILTGAPVKSRCLMSRWTTGRSYARFLSSARRMFTAICLSAGGRRQRFTTITESTSTCWIRRCSAFSSTG